MDLLKEVYEAALNLDRYEDFGADIEPNAVIRPPLDPADWQKARHRLSAALAAAQQAIIDSQDVDRE